MNASRTWEAALVLGLAAAVGLALWAGRQEAARGPDSDLRVSTYGTGPAGSQGSFDVMRRLGWPVERRRRPLLDLDTGPRPAVLLVLAPVMPLLPGELAQASQFLVHGGTVVAAGEGGGIPACAGWSAVHGTPFHVEADTIDVRSPRPGVFLPPVSDALERVPGEDATASDGCPALVPARIDTLLVTIDGRPVSVRLWYPRGGSLILWADASYFRNRAWRAGEVPYFVAPLLVPDRPGPIVWDEYHQGYGTEASLSAAMWQWLIGTPGGWALLQVVGVLLLALAAAAVRFGPPQAVVERRRRSPLEHVDALAAGLEGAHGADVAVRLVVSGLRRRLARLGAASSGDDQAWLAALERASATSAGRQSVRRLERCVREPGGDERVLAAAQAVEDVWEELHPPTTHARS
jgi:hypothetical protein